MEDTYLLLSIKGSGLMAWPRNVPFFKSLINFGQFSSPIIYPTRGVIREAAVNVVALVEFENIYGAVRAVLCMALKRNIRPPVSLDLGLAGK